MSCAQDALPSEETALITTTEAGRLVGRTNGAIRGALLSGSLAGERRRDRWFVKAGDVIAWAAHTRPGHGRLLPVPRTEEVVGLLEEYGSASAEEVAKFLSLHPGNARKYLAMLGLERRALRRADGQWVLVSDGWDQEAPTAS